ncbi:MAG: bifunctional precorrin-2 dehydrogenase/sirohydrochlorin ferrochelatase [Candidatus Heimdallarchaeota archaeon]
MLIDLKLAGKTILIVGGGSVGERKAGKFLQANSKVIVVSESFTDGLKQLAQRGKVKLMKANFKADSSSIGSLILNSDVVIAATDNRKLNEDIAIEARKRRVLVCAVDKPSISDFYLPATTRFGKIRIAISTGGRSPAMARILRKKLEEAITSEEVLQVELQHYARKLAKTHISNKKARRSFLYQIIQNSDINHLLKEGNFEEAKALAKQILEHY